MQFCLFALLLDLATALSLQHPIEAEPIEGEVRESEIVQQERK